MSRVTYSQIARQQLREIGRYIAKESPARARSFVKELESRCEALTTFPGGGSPLPPEYGPGIRRAVYRRYLIFYRPTSEGVEVLRIFHGARDIGPEDFQ